MATLVYVAAFAPGDGESVDDLVKPFPPAPWQASLEPDSAGYLRLKPAAYQTYFAGDLPKDVSATLATTQGATNGQVLGGKITAAAWKSKPSWWALSAADQMIPPAFQQAEATRIKAKATTIPGAGHTEMISHPREVAQVILEAASGR